MPELPEVETVRATLERQIVGEKIVNVIINYPNIIQEMTPVEFKRKLINQKVEKISRYGKYLFFIFNDVSLISHLRMEGKYFIKDKTEYINKHEHIIFEFESGRTLRYHDTRKFGTMKIVDTTIFDEIMKEKELARLGKEGIDVTLTGLELYNKIKTKMIPIKTALLDQTIICGLGNIYVDEVCFLSKIHPTTPCKFITKYKCDEIVKHSKIVLKNAIKAGGTTIRSYTSSLGVTGRFQINLLVHTKESKPCQICDTIINKIQVGGRGTYFCPVCQPEKKKIIVGITGGIACGKSSVSTYLTSLKYCVIDADLISKDLTKPEGVALKQIKETFGEEYFDNGMLNREKLGKLIFSDPVSNQLLTSIIHPLVFKEIVKQIDESMSDVVFIDVPLLFESNFDSLCNYVMCVVAKEELVIERLMARDSIDADYAMKKIKSQMDINLKKQKSHFIIDNSYELCYTYKQIDDALSKILK